MIRRPPRSTRVRSSAASDVYKRQGLERLAMYLQGVDSVYDIAWNDSVSYGEIFHQAEVEFSTFNFEEANVEKLISFFDIYEQEALKLLEKKLILPAYDYCL